MRKQPKNGQKSNLKLQKQITKSEYLRNHLIMIKISSLRKKNEREKLNGIVDLKTVSEADGHSINVKTVMTTRNGILNRFEGVIDHVFHGKIIGSS